LTNFEAATGYFNGTTAGITTALAGLKTSALSETAEGIAELVSEEAERYDLFVTFNGQNEWFDPGARTRLFAGSYSAESGDVDLVAAVDSEYGYQASWTVDGERVDVIYDTYQEGPGPQGALTLEGDTATLAQTAEFGPEVEARWNLETGAGEATVDGVRGCWAAVEDDDACDAACE
jgi:hypothetical protein